MTIPLNERIERLKKWYSRENERPLVGFFYDSQYPLHRYHCENKLPAGKICPEDIRVEDFLDESDRLYQAYEVIGGDLIWSAAPFWGIPWLEASLGCKVFANHNTGSTYTVSNENFSHNCVLPKFSETNQSVAKLLEFIPALEERSNHRYPVGMTLLRGISDLLSALYGGEKFLFRMMEAPDEIHSIVTQLTDYWISFGKCLLDHLPMFHGGTGSFFYGVWCPGKTIWFQEDAAALLSPSLFEQFIFPAVVKITESFDNSVIHLHPSQFIPTDYLLKTNVNVIELHRDIGGPTAEELRPHHEAILSEQPLIIWGDLTNEDLEYILKNLSYKGLAIIIVIKEMAQANKIWNQAMKLISSSK